MPAGTVETPRPKAVFFDVGETLVNEGRYWREAAAAAGLDLHVLLAALGATIARGTDHGEIWALLGVSRPAAVADLEYRSEDLYPDAVPCLERVSALGLRVGLAGNQSEVLERWTRATFPSFVVGSSAGWGARKPSPAFGHLARPDTRRDSLGAMSELRVGMGFDAHALAEGIPLVLAGTVLEYPRGLVGYSDGDVVTHALIDALLGAADLGDLGSFFPSDDEEYRGASSLDLLWKAYREVRDAGWSLLNADCVLIAEEPRIAPLRDVMAARLAEALGVEIGRVTVRATTTDGLGFAGRGEGIAAHAVALLVRGS